MSRKPPKLCYHRGAGRWYCTLDGKEHYLGGRRPWRKVPPVDVRAEYDRVVGAWLSERGRLPVPVGPEPTVAELWEGYRAYSQARYTRGRRSEVKQVHDACAVAAALHGGLKAAQFGPKALAGVREEFCKKGWTRQYVNAQVSRVRRMFRWAVREELLPVEAWLRLKTLEGLVRGERPGLPEGRKVTDVPDAVVEATVKGVGPYLRALVMAHRLIGCRAEEACGMTAAELERLPDPLSPTGETWRFTPRDSKNGESYWVGPKAQAVILPYLRPDQPGRPLFLSARNRAWTGKSYHAAVTRAAARAGQPYWTPLQLRHRAAEEARQGHERGVEAVQARLRHSRVETAQIYAHSRDELGRDVARRFG